jgi:hypothetical protein
VSIVVAQQITARWMKATRGEAREARRNAVPEIARIPTERIKTAGLALVLQVLVYDERFDFRETVADVQVNPPERPLTAGCVVLDLVPDWVIARFEYDRALCGEPSRGREHKELSITLDQWAQFAYNGRFGSSQADWRYEKTVVNIGVFRRLRPNLFLSAPPTHVFSSIARLI